MLRALAFSLRALFWSLLTLCLCLWLFCGLLAAERHGFLTMHLAPYLKGRSTRPAPTRPAPTRPAPFILP